MKKNNGITLIALVITIIVLLILAGVSIAMLTGKNGILNQATSAKTQTKEKEEEEIIRLIYNAAQIRQKAPQENDIGKSFSELLIDEASKHEEYNIDIESEGTSFVVNFDISGNSYKLDENGNINKNGNNSNGNGLHLSSYFGSQDNWGTAAGTITQNDDGFTANITNTGNEISADTKWAIQAYYDHVKCETGTYTISFKISTDKLRHVEFKVAQDTKDGSELFPLTEMTIYPNNDGTYSYDVVIPEGVSKMSLVFALGAWTGDDPLNTTNQITLSDLTITKK